MGIMTELKKNLSGHSMKSGLIMLTTISFCVFLYHMLTGIFAPYGYFIDEFYYVACSKRLAFGYIDHPPLSILLLAINRWLLGESVAALRFLPALASAGTVFFSGLIARRLGGSKTAMYIAALATGFVPIYLLMGSFYSMNSFEICIWAVISYYAIRLVQEDNPKHFIVIGIFLGLGLEMKHTMILYAIALTAGLLLTPQRRLLRNRWFWGGMAICVLLLIPNIIWQYVNGFPSVEFYRNAMINKNIPTGPLKIIIMQFIFTNPFAAPLWIAGVVFIFVSNELREFRFLGITFVLLLGIMLLSQSSRPDRIAAIYSVLFAAGAVAVEKISIPRIKRTLTFAAPILIFGGGLWLLPVVTPLLPPPMLIKYVVSTGLPLSVERGKTTPAVQWLADRLGWHELASKVAGVYHALPPDEQRNCVIISTNYGEAGALELYGKEFGLPPVFATHNSFHSWGPPSDSVKTYIGVYVNREDLESRFESVEMPAVQTCEYCTPPQQRIPIYVARGPKFSVQKEWPGFKSFD